MIRAIYILLFTVVLLQACEEAYTPKPKGYNRLDLPEREYVSLPDSLPYTFQVSKAAKLLRDSSYIAERYWLARTLGNSRNPATYDDLLHFLNDPHPNVVTMALHAIGKRGNRDMADEIMHIITTTDNWYIQWYAYKALRSIGWRQTKSN